MQTIKPLEDYTGGNLGDLVFGDDFLNTILKAQFMKRIDNVDFIKIKSFCSVKGTLKRIKG